MEKIEYTETVGKFDLEAPPTTNYLNTLLLYMKNYQLASQHQDDFFFAIRSLSALIIALPPRGREYMREALTRIQRYYKNVDAISSYTELDAIFARVMDWAWPNLFEVHFNIAKPRSKEEPHISETDGEKEE